MWCVLLAAGTGYFAKCWRYSANQPSVQVIVEPDQDSSLHDVSEIATLAIHEDLPPRRAGDNNRMARVDAIEVDKNAWCDSDTNATNNQSSIFNFNSKESFSEEKKPIAVSSKNKEAIRSKIAKKGWENYDRRFKGWRKFPRKIIYEATVFETEISQTFPRMLLDQENAEVSAGTSNQEADTFVLFSELSAALCPLYNGRGRSSSSLGVTDPKRQRLESLDEGTCCQEEPAAVLEASACCVSQSKRKGFSNAAVPGEILEISNMQTIKNQSSPLQFHSTFINPELEQIYRDSVTGRSACEGLTEQQKQSAYEKQILPDAVMEPRQTRLSRTSIYSFKDEKLKSLQDMLESKSGGSLQSQIVSQKPRQTKRILESFSKWEKESDFHYEAKSLRTMDSPSSPPLSYFRPKECDSFAREQRNCQFQLSTSSYRTELNVNHKIVDATDVGDVLAFCNVYLSEAEAKVKAKDSEHGGTAKGNESKNMQTLPPLPLDVHVLTTLEPNQDEEPQQKDGSMSNGYTVNQLRTLSCLSQRGQLLKTKESLSRGLLPLFLKKQNVTDCLQSISALGASPQFMSSEMTISSNELLSFTFGLGVGLMFTWSSCHDYKSKQVRSYEDPEFAFDIMKVPSLSPGVGVKFEQTVAQHLDSLIDAHEKVEVVDDNESVKSALTEENVPKEDCMSDLEAELEAELKLMQINLVNADCLLDQSTQSEVVDLDQNGFSTLLQRDLTNRGLPRMPSLEQNKYDHAEERGEYNNHSVSPRELEYRLRLLLEERQQVQIFQLEKQLQDVQQKLQLKEAELREWKDQVRHLVNFSFTSTGNDAIDTTWSSNLKEIPYGRDTLDVYSEIESDDDLLTVPKQQQEKLIFPVKENSCSTCSFGSAFGWLEDRTSRMEDCHNISVGQNVDEQDAPSRKMNCNFLLENMDKNSKDWPVSENPMHYNDKMHKTTGWMPDPPNSQVKRKSNATKTLEANLSPFNGCESDGNSSCISICSTAFCNYIDDFTMPLCEQISDIPMEKAADILPLENLEFFTSKPLRSSTTGRKVGRGRRKCRKNDLNVNFG